MFFKRLLKHFKPRYHLALDSHYHDFKYNKNIYRFKIYGLHEYLKITYEEILQSKELMNDINPQDLIHIAIKEYEECQKKNLYKISEILRDNYYKLSNDRTTKIIAGEEICDNPALLEQIKNIDLYKIAHNTGFIQGRQFSKDLNQVLAEKSVKQNIVNLTVLKTNKDETR